MNNRQKILTFYKQYEIPFWTHGKNVSEGSINVQCPYCNDHSNHMGTFIEDMVFNCWRCNRKGPFYILLSTLTGLPRDVCKELVEDSDQDFKEPVSDQIKQRFQTKTIIEDVFEVKEISWPEFSEEVDFNHPLVHSYMKRRNISKETILFEKCKMCKYGKYANRLIIPIFFNKQLVSYQAADMTGKADLKYDTAKGNINNFLYGYDDIDDIMILTEGALDKWRTGSGAVCTFGTSLTDNQKNLILLKPLEYLIFLWDSDAYWKARKAAEFFRPFIENVCIIKLPSGQDPDSFGTEAIWNLIEEKVC